MPSLPAHDAPSGTRTPRRPRRSSRSCGPWLPPPCQGDRVTVEPIDVLEQAADAVAREYPLAAGRSHPVAQVRIGGELGEPGGERGGVARFDDEAVDPVTDDV